ncbi:MAG: hypothetical protein J4G18_07160 [Anaerolineae bacterium]|nr:hypothetical protein [Anaerolineae bacterium]
MTYKPSRAVSIRAIAAIALLALIVFVAIIAAVLSNSAPGSSEINAQSYAEEVSAALANADTQIGGDLVYELECDLCHLQGDGSVSPLFFGLADVAAERRPPLSAEQYLYEAILFPALHLVEGYSNSMPNNYQDRLSQQDVGHIIAYLLGFKEGVIDP